MARRSELLLLEGETLNSQFSHITNVPGKARQAGMLAFAWIYLKVIVEINQFMYGRTY